MGSLTSRAGSSFGYWSKQTTDDEYLAALKFPKGSAIYDQMRRSDPQINAVLQAIFSPIMAAKWVVEPAEEKNVQAEEIAKFVEDNLFPAKRDPESMIIYSTPWMQTLRNVLLHVPFGFMVMEKVYAAVEGQVVLQDLGPRLPKTISEFHYDKNGNNLIEIIQKVAGVKFTLPAEKCIIFTFNKEGSNAVGIPLLRPLYKPWAIKDDLEKIQAIMFERFGVGVPHGTVGPTTKPGDPEFAAMEDALEEIASNESGYIVTPDGQMVDILTGGSSAAPDIITAIQYYDNQMAIAYHAMFMMLGSSNSGNRALGETFMDFFLTTVQSIGDNIADTFNNDLIPELVQLNYDTTAFPKLRMLEIQDINFDVIASLKTAGLITSTESTETRLRDLLGLNELEEGESQTESVEEADVEEADVEEIAAHTHHKPLTFARRKFTEDEVAFGLPAMEVQLDKKHLAIGKQLIVIRDRQSKSLADQISSGKLPSNVMVPHKKEMYSLLLEAYKEQRELGKAQELKNARRQGLSLSAPSSANDLLDLIERMLSVEVEGAANKIKSMMLSQGVMLERQGLTGTKLELALLDYVANDMSEVTWMKMASTAVNGGWGDGHISTVEKLKDMVNFQTYSAVLDDNTCQVCQDADNTTHVVGDPDYIAPNPGCLGGDRCRCVNITFYKV